MIKTDLNTGEGDPCAGHNKLPEKPDLRFCSCGITMENLGVDDPTGSK